MTRRKQRTILWAALLSALLLAVTPLHLAYGQASEDAGPVKVRLAVGDVGVECLGGCDAVTFGSSQWEYTLEVAQGTLVELTFVWAHQGFVGEEHIMVLSDYNLEWDEIDHGNQEATLQFIADRPGTFNFKCDLQCELHDYIQYGYLRVTRTGGGGGVALTPTVLTVSPSTSATRGAPVTLMATLRDAAGAFIPKAVVHFYVKTEFVGTEGQMEIGRAKTDANGVAFFEYRPTLAVAKHTITARFDGMAAYDGSEQTFEIEELGVPPAAYTTAPVGLDSLRHWAPRVLVAVVLGIWAIYAFVLFQVYSIFQDRNLQAEAPK